MDIASDAVLQLVFCLEFCPSHTLTCFLCTLDVSQSGTSAGNWETRKPRTTALAFTMDATLQSYASRVAFGVALKRDTLQL